MCLFFAYSFYFDFGNSRLKRQIEHKKFEGDTCIRIALTIYSIKIIKDIYEGDKLSLNVYIFHVLIGGAIGIVWNHIQTTACADKVFAWMLPIITVVIAVLWAYLLEKGKVVLKKRRVRG